jgi:hypothetical protein
MDEHNHTVTAGLSYRQQEDAVLQYFADNWTTNPKKLKKMALKIWADQPDWIQRGLLQNIIEDDKPAQLLEMFFTIMAEWKDVVPKLIADGNHGMIIKGSNEIHGFDLKANPKWLTEDDLWNHEQEIEIQDTVIRQWMAQEGLTKFHGKIVLFDEFGFSGMLREIIEPRPKARQAK